MAKFPYMQFYTGDWIKDPKLSRCSEATRGIYMDAICAMHEDDRSGTLSGTPDVLSRLLRCPPAAVHSAATELKATGAADVIFRNGVITITNRRMHREYLERLKTRERVAKFRRNADVQKQSESESESESELTEEKIFERSGEYLAALGVGNPTRRQLAKTHSVGQILTVATSINPSKASSFQAVLISELKKGEGFSPVVDAQAFATWCRAGCVAAYSGQQLNGHRVTHREGKAFVDGKCIGEVEVSKVEFGPAPKDLQPLLSQAKHGA